MIMKKNTLFLSFLLSIFFSIFNFQFSIFNSFAQLNVSFLSQYTYSGNLSNIWGFAGNGREYALVGEFYKTSVVDVTDPAHPVEVFHLDAPRSEWREIKTWSHYAYITHDQTSSGDTAVGLTIIDLGNLPGDTNLAFSYFTGNQFHFHVAHDLFIDEHGVCYLFGSNHAPGSHGVIMLDVATDPMHPHELGTCADSVYVHDGYARGDTLWAACIWSGQVQIFNVSDKQHPVEMTTFDTPNHFTHNCWLSDDSHYLFTTDEKSGAYVASYDVSDFSNIKLLDKFRALPGTGVIPHNTHYKNGYLVTSYYTYGITIIDAHNPSNLIEVGHYDTSPFSGDGFHGCWGVYPYLPSGNILASDIEQGMFVLGPTYTRACYLEGTLTDLITGDSLFDVNVRILVTNDTVKSSLKGKYSTGFATTGAYSVSFYKPGYHPITIDSVVLNTGLTTILNVPLIPDSIHSGIEKIEKKHSLNAYPIPFSSSLQVEYSIPDVHNATLVMKDVFGRTVFKRETGATGRTTIDGDFPDGIYFIFLMSEKGKTEVLKVVRCKM